METIGFSDNMITQLVAGSCILPADLVTEISWHRVYTLTTFSDMDLLKEVAEAPNKLCDVSNEPEPGTDSGHVTESDDGEVISEENLKKSDLGVDEEPAELKIGEFTSYLLIMIS